MENLTDNEFKLISEFAKEKLGVTFSKEKKALIYARLRNRLTELNLNSFDAYIDFISKDKSGHELIYFTNKMTTNHTYFMRESEHFYYLSEQILPLIEKQTATKNDLRLWCAGCSSGEEAYMLAMFVDMYYKNKSGVDTHILATDISTNVISKAIRAVYPNESLDVLEKSMIKNYFEKFDEENVIVKKELREKIIFRRNNLIYDDFNFKKPMQIIFCRNVMIYFDNETKTKLIKKFYDATEPGGFLIISHSESLSHLETDYVFALPGIYRKPLGGA